MARGFLLGGSKAISLKTSIAVVGGGIAGIAAAHLLARAHRVTLFEQNSSLGGHANTYVVPRGVDAGTRIDTGFIVFNRRTYPSFSGFLDRLGVSSRATDMSFGYHCRYSGLQYGGHDLFTLFAQPLNALYPDFLRLVIDMVRFNRRGRSALANGGVAGSLLDLVRRWGLSSYFLRHYLVPLGASLWSAPAERMGDFPAQTYLRFFANHGLLSLTDRPPWETVQGGSQTYVQAFLREFDGEICLQSPVEQIDQGRLRVDGEWLEFDQVVVACHADQALRLLAQPSPLQRELLSPWRYSRNSVVLHTDGAVMPPLRKVWSSWNYVRDKTSGQQVTVSYWMNRLQGLRTRHDYFVSLNSQTAIRESQVVASFEYSHPQFDLAAGATQPRLPELNTHSRLSFCGSYFGYGFHEDAFASAVAVGRKFGVCP